MTIYFLLGRTGTGKTYVGENLKRKTGLPHYDGDKFITQEMRDALEKDIPLTRPMIDAFVEKLKGDIALLMEKHPGESFIISQALYMNEHREILLSAHPELRLIWVDSDEGIRQGRIKERFINGDSRVSPECAREMDTHFEAPEVPYDILMNDGNDVALLEDFQEIRVKYGDAKGKNSQIETMYSPTNLGLS